MYKSPAAFQEFLTRNNYIDDIYDALAEEDKSVVVLKALLILRQTNHLQRLVINYKTEERSTNARNLGNEAYRKDRLQEALSYYNEALLHAPINSREMVLAYSNRSALFVKICAYNACNNDIEKCFKLGCPHDLVAKLSKRKSLIWGLAKMDQLARLPLMNNADKCINLNIKRNSQLPCTSCDIKIDISTSMPRVIASRNIKSGTVVAIENSYVSFTDFNNIFFSCHYCQKKELNLIPCDGCTHALFCNEDCKTKCMNEYHKYECKIMDAIKYLCNGPNANLMVKACLKFKSSCNSWKELVNASYNMGLEKIKSSSNPEIDINSKYSILCYKDDRTFTYGVQYSASFVCAALLHYIEELNPSFLPKDLDDKHQAMQGLARIMMFLSVYQIPSYLVQPQNNLKLDQSNFGTPNFGLFPFIGKLKNSCKANTVIANKNNILVLISLLPINKGEDLTIPYLWDRVYTIPNEMLQLKSFQFHGTVCGCHNCNNYTVRKKIEEKPLSMSQKKYFHKIDFNHIQSKINIIDISSVYSTLLEALTVLKDVPNSQEFCKVYQLFRRCVNFCELIWCDNIILDANMRG